MEEVFASIACFDEQRLRLRCLRPANHECVFRGERAICEGAVIAEPELAGGVDRLGRPRARVSLEGLE